MDDTNPLDMVSLILAASFCIIFGCSYFYYCFVRRCTAEEIQAL